ncbi:class I histocompatibility antigen, F10 alpha chain-like [Dendropsophus ebraccatus]|uniref:class I histocompatibility antigen, F10 alpha chain-like n=1 Tax=Dendropsophus ebraccatus TaxID=150705 RepID=UPI00383232B7
MYVLPLILLSLDGVYSESHSLRHYYIGVSAPGSGLPEFTRVGYVDDQQTELYSSDTGRTVPVAPWIKENVAPEYWEDESKSDNEDEALFRHEVNIGINWFNHSEGFHFLQVKYGCDLRDDGSTNGYHQFRYDGRDFMYLDVPTATYIPTMAEAQITTDRWNSPDVRMGELEKITLENTCIETLKTYLKYGREYLERKVRPGVRVTGRESGDITTLYCLVYGFQPRAVDVKWVKNRIDDIPTDETTGVLPNPDGTYQIRVTAEVIPKDGDSYSCYVDHSSLEEPLLVRWEPKQHSPLAVIIGAVAIVLVFPSVVAVLIYRRKNHPYTAASNVGMREDEGHPGT